MLPARAGNIAGRKSSAANSSLHARVVIVIIVVVVVVVVFRHLQARVASGRRACRCRWRAAAVRR